MYIDLGGRTRRFGLARSNRARSPETILFEYDRAWLDDSDRFSLEPALALTRGAFAPPAGLATFGSIGDSAPDTPGSPFRAARRTPPRRPRRPRRSHACRKRLFARRRRRNATLRALRFRWVGDETFQAPARAGVPALIELGQLLQITVRILRDEETDEDSPAHRRGPPSVAGGRRPRSSTNTAVPRSPSFQRKPAIIVLRPGRRLRCGSPARLASPSRNTN